MIRYFGSPDSIDILNGNVVGTTARKIQPPQATPTQTPEAIQPKSKVTEDLGASLQSALKSFRVTLDTVRTALAQDDPSAKGAALTAPIASRLESGGSVASSAARVSQTSRAPLGLSAYAARTRLEGTEEIPFSVQTPMAEQQTAVEQNQVRAGRFTVNGETIPVFERDSVSSVLRRISENVPGVQAQVSENRVVLSSTSASPTPIVAQDDTSGFLEAVKLTEATSSVGRISDLEKPLSKIETFSSVSEGSFEVNGVKLTVRPQTDTLASVLKRVSDAGLGVAASYDTASDRVRFESQSSVLALSGDQSGFLAAANLDEGVTAKAVNLEGPFNVQGFAGPRLKASTPVVAGQFELNGVAIEVHADDSIQKVLDRINASGADVNASFNQDTQTLALESKVPGPVSIQLGSDSSGFLAAMSLDKGARFTPGASPKEVSPPIVQEERRSQMASAVSAQVQQVTQVLQKVSVDPAADPGLKAAIRAALSQLVSTQVVQAVGNELSANKAAIESNLRQTPSKMLNALSAGVSDVVQKAMAFESQAASGADSRASELQSIRFIPGVVPQAEVVVQGRLMTLLISLPRMHVSSSADAGSAELAKAARAYEQSLRNEHDPPLVQARSGPSPP